MVDVAKKEEQQDVARDIIRAVKSIKRDQFPEAWRELDVLSNETTVQRIGVDPAGVIVRGNQFEGLAAVVVALNYNQPPDPFTTAGALRAEFRGHMDAGTPKIDEFSIDTSPFSAGSNG